MRPTAPNTRSSQRYPHPCHPERSEGPVHLRGAPWKCIPAAILIIIVVAIPQPAAAQSDTPGVEAQRYDGNWWRTTSTEERTTFITGTEECRTFDRKLVRKIRWSEEDFARAVDRYYQKTPTDAAIPVSLVMDKLNIASPVPQPRRPAKSPAVKTPHGALNASWWRNAAGDEQLGYVEGYLSCRALTRSAKPLHFSKRALDYVQMVSGYYADDVKHETEKLADVLLRFADPPPPRPDKKHRSGP
jgi:hypothetical protein